MQRKLILKNRFLAVLTLTCLVMQIIQPSKVWGATILVLGGLLLVSLAWAISLRVQLSIEREIRFGWTQVGDHLEERFILTNLSPMPALWVEVIDQSDLPGHEVSRATGVDARTEIEWRVGSICERRGLYTLGPTLLRTGDPFGIFQVEIFNPARRSVMIMPPVVALPEIEIAPGGRAGAGRPRPNAPEKTVSASGVREYSPGDSLRWVHWPTTARRQTYFVRLFDGTPAGDWRIVVDLNRRVQTGSGRNATEEHAVILAASISDLSLRQKRVTSLVINGSPFTWLHGRADASQRWEILRSLALANLSDTPLEDLLKRLSPDLPANSSLVLITADVSGAWLPALMSLLWRGITPTVLLLDPESFSIPAAPLPPPDPAAQTGTQTEPDAYISAANRLSAEMKRQQIQHHIIPRELLNQPDSRPGHAGEWTWKVSGSGRAVAVQKPGDLGWRRLG